MHTHTHEKDACDSYAGRKGFVAAAALVGGVFVSV